MLKNRVNTRSADFWNTLQQSRLYFPRRRRILYKLSASNG
jgi:hypothetical protein